MSIARHEVAGGHRVSSLVCLSVLLEAVEVKAQYRSRMGDPGQMIRRYRRRP